MFETRVHAYLRALHGARAERTGPFLAAFDAHDANPFRNYAIPDDDAQPTTTEVEDLIAALISRDRLPRLEYLPGTCPAVEPTPVHAGFVPERRLPVMICPPAEMAPRPNPEDIEVLLAETAGQLRDAARAQNDAYGQFSTDDNDVARLRGTVESGGLVALARQITTRIIVGAGLCAPPHNGVSELAAIGVREPFRRRGVATALTVFLTQQCPSAGITTPFLTPAGDAEERIYRSAGYRTVTEMLHISR